MIQEKFYDNRFIFFFLFFFFFHSYNQKTRKRYVAQDMSINSIKMDILLYSMLTIYFGVPPSAKIQQFHPIKACFFVYYLLSLSPVPLTFGHRNCCVCHVKLFIKQYLILRISLEKGECFNLNHSLGCLPYFI